MGLKHIAIISISLHRPFQLIVEIVDDNGKQFDRDLF
jgi:hypothetical protein